MRRTPHLGDENRTVVNTRSPIPSTPQRRQSDSGKERTPSNIQNHSSRSTAPLQTARATPTSTHRHSLPQNISTPRPSLSAAPPDSHPTSTRRESGVQNGSSWYQFPSAILPSVFGYGTDITKLRNVVSDLHSIQHDMNGTHRFHLIVESCQGQLSSQTAERFDHIVTRVLFSPSISLETGTNDSLLSAFVRNLNAISWRSSLDRPLRRVENRRVQYEFPEERRSSPNQLQFNPETGILHQQRRESLVTVDTPGNEGLPIGTGDEPVTYENPRYSNTPLHSDMFISIDRRPLPDSSVANWYACHRNDVTFPYWFPFLGREYTSGPQSTGEPLYVSTAAIDNFEALEMKQVQWIYRELFEFLFREAKRKKKKGIPSVFCYACFTPPWLRSQIIKGKEGDFCNQTSMYFSNVVIPDMRNQRSKMGTLRLAFILGAFLENEPALSRKPLVHLLRTVPVKPTLQKAKRKVKVGYMLPLPSTAPIVNSSGRDTNENQVRNERRDNNTVRGENEQVARESVFNSIGSRGQTRQNPRPTARRIYEQPIDVDAEAEEGNGAKRNVRRRIEYGTQDQICNEQDGIVQHGFSRRGETMMRRRRRIPRMRFPADSSDDDFSLARGAELSGDSDLGNEREPNEEQEE